MLNLVLIGKFKDTLSLLSLTHSGSDRAQNL